MSNKKVNVGGILFDNIAMNDAILKMEDKINKYKGKGSSLLLVANQDIINKVRDLDNLSIDSLNRSFLIVPDGYSIVYASKYLGCPLKERIAGPDLMYNFMKISNDKSYSHFFLGAEEGVAERMLLNFKKEFPDIKIAGYYSPPFGDFTVSENDKMLKMINDAKPDVLWVSFGCPKQEKWIIDNLDALNVPISAGVGAAFNFHSGKIKRAPKIVQKMRLEWFYRFLQEPGRLWKRYFIGGINFAKIILKQKKSLKT